MYHTKILDEDLARLNDVLLLADQGATVCDSLAGGWVEQADTVVVLHTTQLGHGFLDVVDFRIVANFNGAWRLPVGKSFFRC